MSRWLLTTLVAVIPFQQALAWGQNGHSIVAEIAERRLDGAVAAKIRVLMANTNVSLASLSTWADDTRRSGHAATVRWHFVGIPLDAPGYDAARDCRLAGDGDCAVAAIERQLDILRDPGAPSTDRADALRYVINLVADIHQPLNCASRDGDRGGAGLTVTYSGDRHPVAFETNFHRVWDELLVEDVAFSWGAYVDDLESDWFANNQADFYAAGSLTNWVNDCHQMAVKAYATLPADLRIDSGYLLRNQELLDRQLAVGGIRLARVLNDALK